METIITLDAIKKYAGQKEIALPESAVITGEAKAWAHANGISIKLGDKVLAPSPNLFKKSKKEKRLVISVLGEDKVGIIAGVSGALAQHNVNILDINQTSLQGLFAMVMIVDASECTVSFDDLKEVLNKKGKEIGVRIDAHDEDVFRFMHRI
ncbi:hypothetical protein H0A61_01088 [Koleobacter methoxysyntrophicus]|jgi:ACT domain-containing protein|uniref:UPF0237 protein H0A61_01088 n=1 Tax=Koleobacter methoxysyntrophicus TaxID=2751313 RepID=A0A8A0RK62_9FIRM|nr:ACT domain-containing protein [Koleobacter methoxysyntrophicus]NPV44920.1 ACT domain-containing protein [Bacillota bacterium]QSQ08745.1 hypothetical protein H0A61_01088 [Koleobacter methoxysyntrophicus]